MLPSLPGFGFSGPTPDTGWGPRRIARAWAVLMARLGYERYGAAGNDWGSFISPELAHVAPDAVVGVHVTQAWATPPDDDRGSAYGMVHSQVPQTLAHALADSPVGLLGRKDQCMDDLDNDTLLTHVTPTSCRGPTTTGVATTPRIRHPTCWCRTCVTSSAGCAERHHLPTKPLSAVTT